MSSSLICKSKLRTLFHMLLISILSGCGLSGSEKQIFNACKASAQYLDAYTKEGVHLPDTESGKRLVFDVCWTKSELYVEGYRVSKTISLDDVALYRRHLMSELSLREVYLDAIR